MRFDRLILTRMSNKCLHHLVASMLQIIKTVLKNKNRSNLILVCVKKKVAGEYIVNQTENVTF